MPNEEKTYCATAAVSEAKNARRALRCSLPLPAAGACGRRRRLGYAAHWVMATRAYYANYETATFQLWRHARIPIV